MLTMLLLMMLITIVLILVVTTTMGMMMMESSRTMPRASRGPVKYNQVWDVCLGKNTTDR